MILNGYKDIKKIHKGQRSIIYHAIRESDDLPVSIKFCSEPFPRAREISRLQHEYKIGKLLNGEFTSNYLDLIELTGNIAIVIEFFEGEDLKQHYLKNKVDLNTFFHIARSVCLGIQEIHSLNIVHKDIKPDNI